MRKGIIIQKSNYKKKKNKYNNSLNDEILKNQKRILIFSILCVITLFVGTSYALLTNFDKTDNVITIKSGNLTMTVANDLITLNNKLPESDAEGIENSTPVVITLTNTGTMDIMKYDVKLVKEESSNTSTLEEQYIKYAISTDGGTTYNTASVLTSNNNIIFTGYNLSVNESDTIYLKTWIDESAKNNAVGKIYYGSVKVDLYQKFNIPLKDVLDTNLSTENIVERYNVKYLSANKEDIDNNYVWYSGKLWRIVLINPDNSIKLITDDIITNINFGINGGDDSFYTDNENKSFMYQWLNEDFLDTLYNYENIIVTNSKWNVLKEYSNDISAPIVEGADNVKSYIAPVGLLNSYEYYRSWKNYDPSNGYLNTGYYWWLLNPLEASCVWTVDATGDAWCSTLDGVTGVRPSINLKSDVLFAGGLGTKSDPYKIVGDKEKPINNTTLLSTRTSGEYVKFNNELYRIVSTQNNITKINKNDYVRDTSNNVLTKQFSTSITYGGGTSDDYWDYYLNNTWYNNLDTNSKNMIVESVYYIAAMTTDNSYKKTICATASNTVTTKDCEKTTTTWTGLVGLPRFGEMFASQQVEDGSLASHFYTMSPYYNAGIWYISSDFSYNGNISVARAVRPSINLKSSVKITTGKGTKENPFEISL